MTVEPLVPDVAPTPPRRWLDRESNDSAASSGPAAFARVLDALGVTLERAERAENRFAAGAGSLHDAVYARARADVALDVATAAAQRAAQAVQSVLNMAI